MEEVLFVTAGVIICGIAFSMLFILGNCTDRFGQCFGIFGFGGIVISIAYFGTNYNNYLFFGFAGLYTTVALILIVISIIVGSRHKKVIKLTSRCLHGKAIDKEVQDG